MHAAVAHTIVHFSSPFFSSLFPLFIFLLSSGSRIWLSPFLQLFLRVDLEGSSEGMLDGAQAQLARY